MPTIKKALEGAIGDLVHQEATFFGAIVLDHTVCVGYSNDVTVLQRLSDADFLLKKVKSRISEPFESEALSPTILYFNHRAESAASIYTRIGHIRILCLPVNSADCGHLGGEVDAKPAAAKAKNKEAEVRFLASAQVSELFTS